MQYYEHTADTGDVAAQVGALSLFVLSLFRPPRVPFFLPRCPFPTALSFFLRLMYSLSHDYY